ncbi:MAG: 3'(2'),5'-bisphosphate nucleotidase CysQ, partial [Bacteroidota bacterium]
DFTVNIALIEAGRPVIGAVYVPVTDELFYSAKGAGAFEILPNVVVPKRIFAASFTLQDTNLKIVASRSHLNQATQDFMARFDRPEVIQRGSSLKIMELARGNAHVYPRLGPTMEWDTGAAHAILLEAGGQLIDEATGKDLRYNKKSLLNPHFIAYGKVREELLAC